MNHSKYKIALFKNDQYVGDIHYMNTGNLKWFKSKEIKRQLDVMRKDLLVISFGEEIAENIIKLLEETK